MQEAKCLVTDPLFAIDSSFLSGMSGATGERIMMMKLASALPSQPDHDKILQGCSNAVSAIASSPLMKFVGETLRGEVGSVASIASTLCAKGIPALGCGKVL